MAPQTTKQWTLGGYGGWHKDLRLEENAQIPKLGDTDVLIKIHAASVNYRELILVTGRYLYPHRIGAVQGSDGAGSVEAVGSRVTRFKPGDNVLTIFNQKHLFGAPDLAALASGVGGSVDGVLRQYGVFEEQGLVSMPSNLSYIEGSSLPCAAVSAWNSLYAWGNPLKAGDWVLTEGTGGVSMFALQFAKAAGAKVIATTSTAEKAERLKKLGADHVVNYKEDEKWGETVKSLTPNGTGVQFVVEVSGPATMHQTFKAIAYGGNIGLVGFLAGYEGERNNFLDCLSNVCSVRGVVVGPRSDFEDMNKAIEANDIHPIIDEKVFSFEQTPDAYQYLSDQQVFGKLCIKIE